MSLLRVHELTKRFGGLTAVDDVSFDVFDGTIKAVIGPNGAGKSTLFNALTGYDRPDHGSVLFDGAELVGRRPRDTVRAGVARTFQNTQLFDELTAGENVMVGRQAHQRRGFVPALLRLPSSAAEDRDARDEAGRLLRLIGIEEWLDTPAADLPAGIRRLVEIDRRAEVAHHCLEEVARQPGRLGKPVNEQRPRPEGGMAPLLDDVGSLAEHRVAALKVELVDPASDS